MDMKGVNEKFKLLAEIIGAELAMKVAETFAGSFVYVPKNILAPKKHSAILKAYKAGKNLREISLLYGYTENYIMEIVRKNIGADQPDLFQTANGGKHENN